MTAPLPLADLRILALTQLGAGPYAMQVLGDLGAEIVKIEDPTTGGDEARAVPPAIAGDSLYYQSFNRNTRGLTLDLRTAAGRRSSAASPPSPTPSTPIRAATSPPSSASTTPASRT